MSSPLFCPCPDVTCCHLKWLRFSVGPTCRLHKGRIRWTPHLPGTRQYLYDALSCKFAMEWCMKYDWVIVLMIHIFTYCSLYILTNDIPFYLKSPQNTQHGKESQVLKEKTTYLNISWHGWGARCWRVSSREIAALCSLAPILPAQSTKYQHILVH